VSTLDEAPQGLRLRAEIAQRWGILCAGRCDEQAELRETGSPDDMTGISSSPVMKMMMMPGVKRTSLINNSTKSQTLMITYCIRLTMA